MKNYFNNCVNWNQFDVQDGLIPMIDNNIQISRKTFLKHVNVDDLIMLENSLCYSQHYKQGLTMASDLAVSYHRSKLYNETVYYFRHSAIEYVFK